jgi:hypothetical protein
MWKVLLKDEMLQSWCEFAHDWLRYGEMFELEVRGGG